MIYIIMSFNLHYFFRAYRHLKHFFIIYYFLLHTKLFTSLFCFFFQYLFIHPIFFWLIIIFQFQLNQSNFIESQINNLNSMNVPGFDSRIAGALNSILVKFTNHLSLCTYRCNILQWHYAYFGYGTLVNRLKYNMQKSMYFLVVLLQNCIITCWTQLLLRYIMNERLINK